MQIPRLALTALVSLLALHAGAVTMVRDHAWLVRGAGDEPILGFRNVPWGKFNSLSVTFTLENCTPADIEAFRVFRLPPSREGHALTHSGTPTLTGAESLRYISGTNDLDPDGDGAFTLTFTQDPNVGGELAHGGSLWVTVDVRETIPVDASITAVPASDLVVDGMRVLTLGAMVEPAGHPTPNRVYPFRHRIAAYTKANVTDIWEREADLRFPTLTDLYVIESGNAAGSGSGNGVWLSSSGVGKPGGSAALLAATLSAPAVIDGVRLRLRAGSEIRGQHEVGALTGSLWAGPGTALTVTRCVIDAAGLVQAYGTDSLSREVTMNGNGDVGLLVGQCNWASSAHLTLTDNTVAIRPGAAIRSRLGTHRAAGGCIANLALGVCDSLTLSGLNLFWYGGAVEGPGGFATQPYVGSRNHTTTEGAPTLGPNGTISILDGTTFPDANLWLNDGDTRTLTLPAGLSDKLPAPEPGVTVLRFATDDDADRARFFDGLDISSTFEDNGATQILATAETDFNVSAMGFDADGLWVEASLSHGTFNAATSLQAIPVTLGGTAARAAPIRTLAEEAPERNVRRLRLDLAQSGTHLFRLRPTLTP